MTALDPVLYDSHPKAERMLEALKLTARNKHGLGLLDIAAPRAPGPFTSTSTLVAITLVAASQSDKHARINQFGTSLSQALFTYLGAATAVLEDFFRVLMFSHSQLTRYPRSRALAPATLLSVVIAVTLSIAEIQI